MAISAEPDIQLFLFVIMFGGSKFDYEDLKSRWLESSGVSAGFKMGLVNSELLSKFPQSCESDPASLVAISKFTTTTY